MCTKKKSLEKNLLKLLESKQIIFSAFKLERFQLPVLCTFSNGKLFAGEKEMRVFRAAIHDNYLLRPW